MKLTKYEALKHARVERFTLEQVYKKTGIATTVLGKRVAALKIKGKCLGKGSTKYYSEAQVNKLLDYVKPHKSRSSTAITVIEYYLEGITGRNIAKTLKMSTKTTYSCIKEFNETGCVTVESKLNRIL